MLRRWFVDHPATLPVRNNDIAALQDIQQAFRLRLVTATNGVSAKVRITHRRGYTHGRVVLVSDGSDTDHVISWGAVVAIEEDGVVATACSDVRVHVGWSWCRVGGPCGTGICTAGGSNTPWRRALHQQLITPALLTPWRRGSRNVMTSPEKV